MAILAFGRHRQSRATRDEDTSAVERWQTDGGRRFLRLIGVSAGLLIWSVAMALLVSGCAQNSEQTQDQPSRQRNKTATEQDQSTQGFYFPITQTNNNLAGTKPVNRGTTTQPVYDATEVAFANAAGSSTIKDPSGTTYNTQINYIQTGGTAADQAGTTTGGATAQTPSQNGTQTPTQTVTPETSASVPIGVALPGGNVSNQATATGRGQTDATKSDTVNQQYAQLQTRVSALAEAVQALTALVKQQQAGVKPLGEETPAKKPTDSQPAS